MSKAKNVLGNELQSCSESPRTGFYRDGCCNTGPEDAGVHTVCVVTTAAFLEFSKARGNDLSTPMPMYGFPGLKPGDQWCLCAERWKEALQAGKAPSVILAATHEATLQYVTLEELEIYALDSEETELPDIFDA
ncbi:MAG: DUF2237 domain-containing protein [Chloroflexi bacterium]|nr:DUF2237 domain-containing protein [Chloroflexota bacterium]